MDSLESLSVHAQLRRFTLNQILDGSSPSKQLPYRQRTLTPGELNVINCRTTDSDDIRSFKHHWNCIFARQLEKIIWTFGTTIRVGWRPSSEDLLGSVWEWVEPCSFHNFSERKQDIEAYYRTIVSFLEDFYCKTLEEQMNEEFTRKFPREYAKASSETFHIERLTREDEKVGHQKVDCLVIKGGRIPRVVHELNHPFIRHFKFKVDPLGADFNTDQEKELETLRGSRETTLEQRAETNLPYVG